MARKIKRKDLLKSPDEFLTFSQKTFNFIAAHSRPFVLGLSVALVLGLGGLGVKLYLDFTASRALAAYDQAVAPLRGQDNFDPAAARAAVQALEKVRDKYGRTGPGRLALLELGALDYDLERFEQAEEVYQTLLATLRKEEEHLRPLLLDSLAYTLEAQGKTAQAAARWEEVVRLPGDLLKEQAYLRLGRAYLALGDKTKAVQAYRRLLALYPQSSYAPLAKAQLEGLGREE